MNEMNVVFSLESPQEKQQEIIISIENKLEDNLKYKFLIGLEGTWTTLKEFSEEREATWVPENDGKYLIMVQAKRCESNKSFDYMSKIDYIVGKLEEKLIRDAYIDRTEIKVGEKVFLTVDSEKLPVMYRYWIQEKDNWLLIKDYSLENTLTWTTKSSGLQEFLIECKTMESINAFDDFTKVEFSVQPIEELEIMTFKCLTTDMLAYNELVFEVQANHEDNRMILYKFIKINSDGSSICIQDYSSKRLVSYIEEEKGDYKLLCMVKDMYSPNEFDDRALIHYSIKPYEEINIYSFTSDLSSPQLVNTPINLKCIARGGKELQYKFKIDGNCPEDSGYLRRNNYVWSPKEPGEYKIEVWVKDTTFTGNYEKKGSLDFIIDDNVNEKVIIEDIILDKKKTVLVGETINIKVVAVGGISLRYNFIVFKDDKEVEKIDFGIHDFVDFTPEEVGKFKLEIRVKDKYSKRDFDCHGVIYIEALECIPAKISYILMPPKEYYMVGDTISLEVISENTKNTFINYVLKINGHSVEETKFVEHKKYQLKPRCSGDYIIELYAKNKLSTNVYDAKKEIKIEVHETLPVTNTKILCDKIDFNVNEAIMFTAQNDGGKEVVYEFYLMEKGDWNLVQKYSRKNDYSFIPFTEGYYRVLVLTKSFYKNISYEDYDIMDIKVHENKL